jgi:hypothetical protein
MENSILYPIDVLFNTSLAVFFICILSGFAFYKLGEKYLTPKNFDEERIVLAESENKIRLRRNISLYVIFSFMRGLLLTIPAALVIASLEYPDIFADTSSLDFIAATNLIGGCCSIAIGIKALLQLREGVISPNLGRFVDGKVPTLFKILLAIVFYVLYYMFIPGLNYNISKYSYFYSGFILSGYLSCSIFWFYQIFRDNEIIHHSQLYTGE